MTQASLDIDPERLEDLRRRHGIHRLALFGSGARGELRPDSDVDVLVEFLPGTTLGLRFITIQDEVTALQAQGRCGGSEGAAQGRRIGFFGRRLRTPPS